MDIAIVGATGLVGRKIIDVLTERNFYADNFYLYSTEKGAGTAFDIFGRRYLVEKLTPEAVKKNKVDLAFFSAGKDVSINFAPLFVKRGAVVVDNSSAFRMRADVPLVVPEVNPEDVKDHSGIIANPNCSTIQAVVALSPLDKYKRIKRIIYTTFQAVSGAGQKGVTDLKNGITGLAAKSFRKQIFSNCIPQVDDFGANGYTFEEDKMINETRKILHSKSLRITATCVRVPVFNCHSESVNVEFSDDYDLKEVKRILSNAPSVTIYDDDYPTAVDADGKDGVYIGRLRRDYSTANALNFWCVADNLRKGAATNAVQIAQLIFPKAAKPSE